MAASGDIQRSDAPGNGGRDHNLAHDRERSAGAAGIFSDPKSASIVEAETIDFTVEVADEHFPAGHNWLSASGQRERHFVRHRIIHATFGADRQVIGPRGIGGFVTQRSFRAAPNPAGLIRRRYAVGRIGRATRLARKLRPVNVTDRGCAKARREARGKQSQRSRRRTFHHRWGESSADAERRSRMARQKRLTCFPLSC